MGERGKESGNGAGKLSGGNIRKSLDLLAGFNATIPPQKSPSTWIMNSAAAKQQPVATSKLHSPSK